MQIRDWATRKRNWPTKAAVEPNNAWPCQQECGFSPFSQQGGLANHYQNRAMPKNGGSLVLVNGPGARAQNKDLPCRNLVSIDHYNGKNVLGAKKTIMPWPSTFLVAGPAARPNFDSFNSPCLTLRAYAPTCSDRGSNGAELTCQSESSNCGVLGGVFFTAVRTKEF
jgi:hypothetical protein